MSLDDEFANVARGQFNIEGMDGGIRLAKNHTLTWEVNDKGMIKSVTVTFYLRGYRQEHVALMLPLYEVVKSLGLT